MDYASGDAEEGDMRYLSQTMMQATMHVMHKVITVVNATTTALEAYSHTDYDEQPYHTSALSGTAWVTELLTGHPERIRCELGVHKHVFYVLINLLRQAGCRDSNHVPLEEQLAIFLYASVTGLSICHLGERFQRSNETISKYFKRILFAFSSPPIYTTYVRLPDADSPLAPEIVQNQKFFPYLANAIGAIDGTHIACHPFGEDRHAARDRNGNFSQNCLAACSFNLCFTYMLSGWDGSAADAHAIDFTIPEGKYYLADAEFGSCDGLLVPYPGHTFGVIKRRFRILLLPPEYVMGIQVHIPPALCLVHNVIRVHDPNEMMEYRNVLDEHLLTDTRSLADGPPTEQAHTCADLRRDQIASEMWEDYNKERVQRGMQAIIESLL
ncbi:hypothetical protein AZE42_11404 [Rhizopogon vesiculosus]|uniref:DUF8040 domain-containing protein n=1 Tax=Rhizopogon vesiculosus TaxID=180088 RepID=A0A1J8PVR5_9AGAM|nr:hypothetical protein AZE42_11404 [Rhizopogon vesiculosus]